MEKTVRLAFIVALQLLILQSCNEYEPKAAIVELHAKINTGTATINYSSESGPHYQSTELSSSQGFEHVLRSEYLDRVFIEAQNPDNNEIFLSILVNGQLKEITSSTESAVRLDYYVSNPELIR